ncbi:MAG TPA: hypothetical protein VGG58_08690 [Candidatus Acidoferrum sp.]|jgi:hypothetical protein
MYPSGALTFQPYLDGPARPETPNGPPSTPLYGGIDVFDAHRGQLRLRVALPEPLAAHFGGTDALRANFATLDETGQRSWRARHLESVRQLVTFLSRSERSAQQTCLRAAAQRSRFG